MWVNCFPDTVHTFYYELFHHGHKVAINVHAALWLFLQENFLESFVAEHVAVLKLTIGIKLLLNSIICQMNCCVVNIL